MHSARCLLWFLHIGCSCSPLYASMHYARFLANINNKKGNPYIYVYDTLDETVQGARRRQVTTRQAQIRNRTIVKQTPPSSRNKHTFHKQRRKKSKQATTRPCSKPASLLQFCISIVLHVPRTPFLSRHAHAQECVNVNVGGLRAVLEEAWQSFDDIVYRDRCIYSYVRG